MVQKPSHQYVQLSSQTSDENHFVAKHTPTKLYLNTTGILKTLLTLIILTGFTAFSFSQESDIYQFLKSQPSVLSVEEVGQDDYFSESYVLKIKQALDHSDTCKGFFSQRVYVSHISVENPVVFITDGYVAIKAGNEKYVNEICPIIQGNQIDVEHRYFGESIPDSIEWKYLTVENAARDHHKINRLFKKFYTGKWVATGISKGGQTSTFYRTFFPGDVDVSVAYVAPLNFGVEDGRHEPFIANEVGSKAKRNEVLQFQLTALKRRDNLFPLFLEHVKEKNYTFNFSLEDAFDFSVLEYSFAIWQWGTYLDSIPPTDAPDQMILDHLLKASDVSYFSNIGMERYQAFFVQAACELGYYGYNTEPFKHYLHIKTARNYLQRYFLPRGVKIEYNPETMQKVQSFLQETNKHMMWIYGEDDPWTATAVVLPPKDNFLKIVKPGGYHTSRINNLPDDQKKKVYDTLGSWLDININNEQSIK